MPKSGRWSGHTGGDGQATPLTSTHLSPVLNQTTLTQSSSSADLVLLLDPDLVWPPEQNHDPDPQLYYFSLFVILVWWLSGTSFGHNSPLRARAMVISTFLMSRVFCISWHQQLGCADRQCTTTCDVASVRSITGKKEDRYFRPKKWLLSLALGRTRGAVGARLRVDSSNHAFGCGSRAVQRSATTYRISSGNYIT